MSSENSKHVQTELDENKYERLRKFARERGLSIKEAGEEALVEWIERQERPDPDDPAFTVFDELDTDGPEIDAREESDVVEEWDGSDVEFTLSEDPPTNGR
jgi:hypothetical protein